MCLYLAAEDEGGEVLLWIFVCGFVSGCLGIRLLVCLTVWLFAIASCSLERPHCFGPIMLRAFRCDCFWLLVPVERRGAGGREVGPLGQAVELGGGYVQSAAMSKVL